MEWTPPSELSSSEVTGYRVHYRLSGGAGTETVTTTSTSRNITGLTNGETYVFSVEVISNSPNILPGESEEMNITLGKWLQLQFTLTISFLPLSTIAPPDTPEGVEATPEAASVRVSWQTVDDADRYIVTFSQVQGTDGLQCHSDSHTASLTVDSGSSTTVSIAVAGDVESTVTDMLRAYTRYMFNVTADSNRRGTSQPSTAVETLTPQTSETY